MNRRRLELAVLGFGALFLGLLLFSLRFARRPSSEALSESLPAVPEAAEAGQPTTVLKGFDYTETLRGKPLFRIRSERTVGFGPTAGLVPNMYALEKVTLIVFSEQGTPVTVQSDRARYDRRSGGALLEGNVRWMDEKGAVGETERVEFLPVRRVLLAPGAVHFSRGTFDVQARSGRYEVEKRQAVLDGPVRGLGAGEGSAGLSSISADAAVYKRDEALIELIGSVQGASTSGERLSCDRLYLKGAAESNRIEWARAEGNVRGTLAAERLPAGGRGRGQPAHYAGHQGALLFAPDGSVRSLSLTGTPAMVETAGEPGRKVRADSIDVVLVSGRPASGEARGHVILDVGKSRGEADTAHLGFSPAGAVASVELAGAVRLESEGRSGSADRAIEVPERGVWVLTADAGKSATVARGASRVSASRIEIDDKHKTLRAEGEARVVFVPEKADPRGRSPTFVGDPSRPTFGKAQRMVFDDANRLAILSGGATLWQGSSSLFGNDITLNDAERTVAAVKNTRTVFSPAPEPGAREADRVASIVTAQRVIYRESASSALFEGEVRFTRGAWRANAERATALFGRDRKIERVEMAGDVSISDQAVGRSAKADKAIDFPEEGKTVLEGRPASAVDAEGNRVAGATLTITQRGRRVEVSAPEGGKTETVYKMRSQ